LSYAVEYNKPIRFLAIEWRENWDRDYPSLILEPVIRYSPFGRDLQGFVEDLVDDISMDLSCGDEVSKSYDGDLAEFEMRGWDIQKIKDYAELLLRGTVKGIPVGAGFVRAREEFVTFVKDTEGETWGTSKSSKQVEGFSTLTETGG
jgi:hypothetical protein